MSGETSLRPLERLRELHAAYAVAFGDASHPAIALMSSALASGSESVASAVVAHIEGEHAKTKEATALAAVSRELDADRRPPRLFGEITIARPTDTEVSPDRYLALDGAVRFNWRYGRGAETDAAGRPIMVRIVAAPTGVDWRMVESLPRALGRLAVNISPAAAEPARQALLAAAVARASTNAK